MPSRAVRLAMDALVASACVLRARTPGTPPGDQDDAHESNTFALPNGNPIRRKVKQFARRQLKKLLGAIPEVGAPIPDRFPLLAPDWSDPMASAMTPIIGAYWDEAGRTTRAKLGLDPDSWEVHDPHLHDAIKSASLKFCAETNATTDLQLGAALDKLRDELAAGLVEHGESIPELTRRVQSVFKRLSTYRAEMIARTEASRAVHAASQQSAKESGVVQGKRWLVSANSCDKCVAVAHEVNESHPKGLPLDQPFAHSEGRAEYADVPHPPLHPHCRCSITYVLTDEYEALLEGHPPGGTFEPGALGPEARPKREREREPREPGPIPPPAWQVGTPIEPARPIGERIAGAKHLEEKRARIAGLPGLDLARIQALESERASLDREITAFLAAGGSREDPRVLERLKEFDRRNLDILEQIETLREQGRIATRKAVDEVLGLAGGDRAGWAHSDGPGFKGETANRRTRAEALGWLEAKVAAGPQAAPVEVTWEAQAGVRAHASGGEKRIVVKTGESAATMVHELGHHVEYRLPGAEKAARDFLAHRVGGQPLESLGKKLGGGYRADEMGRDDDFAKAFGARDAWYVGKHYAGGSTEIISMGLEMVYNDPAGFAAKDPEFFKFILGILDGSMRTP